VRRNTTAAGYGYRWQQLRLRILARDRHVCHYCGGPARTVDHVVPKIEGGTDDPGNLVAACSSCNSRRSLAWVRAQRGGRVADAVIQRGRARRGSDRSMSADGASGRPVFWGGGVGLMSSAGFGPSPDEPDRSARIRSGSGALAAD
jgi:hypothetical protein